jgi:hypothetical protein
MSHITNWLNTIPLIKEIIHCGKDDHAEFASEITISLLFHIIPIIIGIFMAYLTNKYIESFSKAMFDYIVHGEILIICNSFTIPFLTIVLLTRKKRPPFPYKKPFTVILSILYSFTALFFVLRDTNINYKHEVIISLSLITLVLTVVLCYIVIVLKSCRLDIPGAFKTNENNFSKGYTHRGN